MRWQAFVLRRLAPLFVWALRSLVAHVQRAHGAAFGPWVRRVAELAGEVGTAAIALERACMEVDPDTPDALDEMGLRGFVNQVTYEVDP